MKGCVKMQNWKYVYGDYTIEVKNQISKCELYINGQMVDEHKSLELYANLIGDLGNGEKVLASIYANPSFKDINKITCDLYVVKEKLTEISEN